MFICQYNGRLADWIGVPPPIAMIGESILDEYDELFGIAFDQAEIWI